jgi:hypothetical protein
MFLKGVFYTTDHQTDFLEIFRSRHFLYSITLYFKSYLLLSAASSPYFPLTILLTFLWLLIHHCNIDRFALGRSVDSNLDAIRPFHGLRNIDFLKMSTSMTYSRGIDWLILILQSHWERYHFVFDWREDYKV